MTVKNKARRLVVAARSVVVRDLLEFVVAAPAGQPALKIDRDKQTIYGVKVLGRFSRNRHDPESSGTEYSPACMDDAVRRGLYEGMKVRIDHPVDRRKPNAERSVLETFGTLHNVRREPDADGEPCLRGDLRWMRGADKDLVESIIDDVEHHLGVYGLSHNAAMATERFDSATKRLVIESLALVRSVDLVDKPATNRNLWESETEPVSTPKKITIRSLLESQKKRFSDVRWGCIKPLLESTACEGEMDEPDAAVEPDDALWQGIISACMGVINGEGTADDKLAELAKYLKGHEKMTAEKEPVEESEEGKPVKKDDEKKEDDKPTLESVQAENARLKTEAHCRDLCESEDFTPAKDAAKTVLESLVALDTDAKRKQLIGSLKAASVSQKTKPKSGFAPTNDKKGGGKPRDVVESEVDAEAAAGILCG